VTHWRDKANVTKLANGGAAAGCSFDAAGNLQATRYGNGVTNLFQYDRLNRLTNAVWKLNASALASFSYQLGLTGQHTNLSETVNGASRTYGWTYDSLYRLKQETLSGGPSGALSYSFDLVGNRTNRTVSGLSLTNQAFTFNTNDWLNTDSYDANGNTLASSSNSYGYDAFRHIINATNGATVIALTYDGDGNRASKKIGGTTNYYLLDDRNPSGYAQVLEERQGSNLIRVYNYGLSLISQRQVASGTTNYYGYDGHGSARFLLSPTGGITDTYIYDAYGSIIASTGTTSNNYLYCGQQYDPDLGLYYNRARYLNANTGRFLTMDTYEADQSDPQSLHKYLYCQANPVNMADPSGQDGDLASLSFSTGIAVGLASFTAVATVEAKTHAVSQVISSVAAWGVETLTAEGVSIEDADEYVALSALQRAGTSLAAVIATARARSRPNIKVMPVPRIVMNEIADHITKAMAQRKPPLLTRITGPQIRINRANALGFRRYQSAGSGKQWDEYPFAASGQGGFGASVEPVDAGENALQGGIMSAVYAAEDIKPGDQYLVVIVP
jgi:RHS repeat-associated protein